MDSFSDLLDGAFSEASIPSFPDGDLDFENLNFDEKSEEDQTEDLTAEQDEAVLQEATGVLFGQETEDMAENVHEEQTVEKSDDFKSVEDGVGSESPEEGYTSSDGEADEEGSASEEEDEDEDEDVGRAEKPGDLLMSVRCGDEFDDDNKEDRLFAEGRPLTLQGAEISRARNEEQSETESDEEECYFERVPERGNGMTISVGTQEDEQESEEEGQDDSSDPECKGMKIEEEEEEEETVAPSQGFEKEAENPYGDDPTETSLEFPSLSSQNLEDLIAEVDGEECVEKMKEFSGVEHQEAGESFADYPSDFSSCEYVEDRGKNQESELNALPCCTYTQQNVCVEKVVTEAVTDVTCTDNVEATDETEDGFLYSKDLERDAEKIGIDVAAGEEHKKTTLTREETIDSDSYSSSDDEVCFRRTDEEVSDNLENDNQLDGTELYDGCYAAFTRWSSSDDGCSTNNRAGRTDFMNWDFNVLNTDDFLPEYLETAEDTSKAETARSDVNQRPAEEVNSYSVVQREDAKTTSPSHQGSVDDSFFFNTELEASGVSELGQLGDDEYEDERNWEQEKERIEAFYKFYDDSDEENGREERQIKVQFCTDPLSQVIHYETESDTDSLSSSTDREEDLSSTEASDEPRVLDDIVQTKPIYDTPNTVELTESAPNTVELTESAPDTVELTESAPNTVELTESALDLCNTQTCTRKHKCLNMLKLILKMGLVTVMGLLMFWLATDQPEWLSEIFYF